MLNIEALDHSLFALVYQVNLSWTEAFANFISKFSIKMLGGLLKMMGI